MNVRMFALVIGIGFVAVGLLGFVPNAVQPVRPNDPSLAVPQNYGYLLGLFPVNVLHNLVHLATGALGILSYRRASWARTFAQGLAIFYGLLTISGMVPFMRTTFGLIPIFGHDVWLHALFAVPAAYFGFVAPHDRATTGGTFAGGTPA